MRKGLLAALAALGLLWATSGSRADIVSYWSFDSKSGTTVDDLVPDSTHDGTLTGGADITSGGLGFGGSGEALQPDADGNAATIGFLAAADPRAYDFNSDFTWHAYVKTDTETGGFGIIGRAPAHTPYNQGSKILYVEDGGLKFDAGGVGTVAPAGSLADGNWHQIIVTFDATRVPAPGGDDGMGLLTIYVDGLPPIFTGAFNANQYDEHHWEHNGGLADGSLRIGNGSEDFIGDSFAGLIDEVAIFDEELSGSDLSQLINQGPASFVPVLTWDGTNSNWAEVVGGHSSHWTGDAPNALPSPSTPAVVNGGTATVSGGWERAYSLQINGGTVRVASGSLDVEQGVHVGPAGTLRVEGSFFAGSLVNEGTTFLDMDLVSMAVIDELRVAGGSVEASAPFFVTTLEISGGNVYTNGNDLTVHSRLSTTTDALSVAADFKVRGVLDVVDGPGTLELDGKLTMESGSVYEVELVGAGVDRVSVLDDVALHTGSSLSLTIDGLDPFKAGDYILISSSQPHFISGEFGSVTELGAYVTKDNLAYDGATVTLKIEKSLNLGDANLDTHTDVRDFNVWNAHKFSSDTDWTMGDFNGDGMTDVRDFNVWNAHKFTSAPGPAPLVEGQVPEPAALTLLGCGLLALLWVRRRRQTA